MVITVAGKKYSPEYLGIKPTDKVDIQRNQFGQPRLVKSSDGINWELVDCPENYGHPSISINNSKPTKN